MSSRPGHIFRTRRIAALAHLLGAMLAGATAGGQSLDLISFGDVWRFEKGISEPPPGWADRDFDDSAWNEGRSGIGYGDADDITYLDDMRGNYLTVYARRRFEVEDPAAIRRLALRISYDDGFVAYLNGTEVARRGLGDPGTEVRYDTRARAHEAGVMEEIDIAESPATLAAGSNVLAFEVHNESWTDGDLSFVPVLRGCGPGPAVLRGPMLQRLTETSAHIVWDTDLPTSGAVELGTTPELGVRIEAGEASIQQDVRLSGLSPGTEYFYRILADGNPSGPVWSFRTTPPRGRPLRIAALADTERLSPGLLGAAALLESIRPEIAIIAGDLTRGGDADTYIFDTFRRVIPGCAFYPTLGNHDVEDDGGRAYFETFHLPYGPSQTRYYSFDHGSVHLVALDAYSPHDPGSPQHEWLRSDLAAKSLPWTIAYIHESPYSTGTVHGSNHVVQEELVPLFDEFHVDLVFSGHNHNYERTYPLRGNEVVDPSAGPTYVDPRGTIYVNTGGGGGGLYQQEPLADKTFSAVFRLAHHVCRIDIDGGVLRLQAVAPDGEVLDAFDIRKHDALQLSISSLRISETEASSARVSWITDRPADSLVEYGPGDSFEHSTFDESPVTEHVVILSGLEPRTQYGIRVRSRDGAGSEASTDPLGLRTSDLFARGDANRDGELNLSDAVRTLHFLFSGEETATCLDACDSNDDGTVDVTDAIVELSYLFFGGPALPPPELPGGHDPTPDSLDCVGD